MGAPEVGRGPQLWLSPAKNGLSDVARIIASVLLGDPRLAILLVTPGIWGIAGRAQQSGTAGQSRDSTGLLGLVYTAH